MKKNNAWRNALRGFGKRLWSSVSKNLWLKLLSVVCALFLWSYVISSSPTITRDKTIGDLNITVSGQTVLSSRGLAVLTDVSALGEARIRVQVSQSNFSQVTGDNVRVELDLSGIRSAGKQSVRLRGASTYGSVVEVWPQYIDLEVQTQDQRYVPVNVVLTGETNPAYWYSVSRVNPSQVTVTGPTSTVQTVSSAQVNLDVTGKHETHSRVEHFSLLDAQGNAVPGALSKSTASIALTVEIYPTRTLPIVRDADAVLSGQAPDGYQVDSVEVSPAQVVVAAEQTLLDGLTELNVEPVDVTGMNQTFTAIARVQQLKGIKNLSSEEATVTVNISEQTLTKRFSNIQLQMEGAPEGMKVTPSAKRVDVRVEGPYSVVRTLTRDDIQATLNLGGLTVGQYELPVAIAVDNYPDLDCASTPAAINVTVREATPQPQ